MAENGPRGGTRILQQRYRYAVSDTWIENQVDETGLQPPKTWQIQFQLRELRDAEARKRARALEDIWYSIPDDVELPEPIDDPERFLDLVEEWIEEHSDEVASSGEESGEARRRRRIVDFDAEMDAWIEENGSDRLKLGRSRKYKVTSTYAIERGREELPRWWIDTAGKAGYRERVDPSKPALDVETNVRRWIAFNELGLEPRIVWLTSPPPAMAEYMEYGEGDPFDEQSEFEQQEALLIPGYLGRYSAYLPIDSGQRAPNPDDDYWKEDGGEDDD